MGFINAQKWKFYEVRTDLRDIVDEVIFATNKNNKIMNTKTITGTYGSNETEAEISV